MTRGRPGVLTPVGWPQGLPGYQRGEPVSRRPFCRRKGKNSLKLDYHAGTSGKRKKKKTSHGRELKPFERVRTLRGRTWNAAPRPVRPSRISYLQPWRVCLHARLRNLHGRALCLPSNFGFAPPKHFAKHLGREHPGAPTYNRHISSCSPFCLQKKQKNQHESNLRKEFQE